MCNVCLPPIELEDGTVLSIEEYEVMLEKQREEALDK